MKNLCVLDSENCFMGDVVKRCLVVTLLVLLLPVTSWPFDITMELGVRGGRDTLAEHEDLAAGEIYYLQTLPWQKEFCPSAKLYPRLDASLGSLRADSNSGGWLAVGMDAVLSLMGGAWDFEGGFRPTWLFESNLGGEDFGGPVQFTSHAGATLNLGRVALSYRLQHISNASLYNSNPGINLHLVGLGVSF